MPYASVHAGRPAAVSAITEWATEKDVPVVDLADAVRDNVFSENGNPDGIHWGWDGHVGVARAMIAAIRGVEAQKVVSPELVAPPSEVG